MRPQALQAWQHVAILRQLHLRLGVGRLGTHGEDVEDERGAVQNFHAQFALDVAQLLGREFIVEDDHTHLALRFGFVEDVLAYLLQFTLSHIRHRAGAVHLLREALHGDGAGRFGQKFQFVQIFVRLAFVLRFGDEGHEHGGLAFCLRLYKFFHS